MEKENLSRMELYSIIIYGLGKNGVKVNKIDERQITSIVNKYYDLTDERNYSVFKRADILLKTIAGSNLVTKKDKIISIGMDSALRSCEVPYYVDEEGGVEFERAFTKDIDDFLSARERLIRKFKIAPESDYTVGFELLYKDALVRQMMQQSSKKLVKDTGREIGE